MELIAGYLDTCSIAWNGKGCLGRGLPAGPACETAVSGRLYLLENVPESSKVSFRQVILTAHLSSCAKAC